MSDAAPLARLLSAPLVTALINVALLLGLATVAADLTWRLVPAPAADAVQRNPVTEAGTPRRGRENLAEAIVQHHLFGTTQKTPVAAVPTTEDVPDTKLNLALHGVLDYDPESSALAIISEGQGGEQRVYAIGDELPGAATLEEVLPDRVILKRSGRYETLRLPEQATPLAIAAVSRQQPIEAMNAGELRDSIVRNPMEFARKVRTIPYKQDGKLVGYKLRADEYQDVLAQYGLEPDDVITEVNGTALDNPKTSLRTLRSLATATSVDVKILRDGIEVPLFISLQ